MHFLTLVVNSDGAYDAEQQLQQYDCGLEVADMEIRDVEEEDLADFREWARSRRNADESLSNEEMLAKWGFAYHGGTWREGKIWGRGNPEGKWDWYQIGGRWYGCLKVRPTAVRAKLGEPSWSIPPTRAHSKGQADIARKDEILWEAMFGDIRKAVRHWETVVEERSVPPGMIVDGEMAFAPEWYLDTYKSKEKYVHAKSTWSAAAALVDGVWTEGKASCFKSDPDWEINFMRDVIRPLPDHAIITAVDCHV